MIRIAVVDDNEMIRKQVKRFLNTYALKNSVVFEIYTYEDGHLLTLDINHEMHFDLIYLDIEMPIQNGIQVGHWIREIAQDEWMQIVFISGKDGYDRKLFSINCCTMKTPSLTGGSKSLKLWVEKNNLQSYNKVKVCQPNNKKQRRYRHEKRRYK